MNLLHGEQVIYAVDAPTHQSLSGVSVVRSVSCYHHVCVQVTLFLIMALKHKNNDAGNLVMSKTRHKVSPLSEKGESS